MAFSVRERVASTNGDSYQILKLRPPASAKGSATLHKLIVCYASGHRSLRHELSSQDFTLRHKSAQALSSAYLKLLPRYINRDKYSEALLPAKIMELWNFNILYIIRLHSKGKGKANTVQAWTGIEVSRKLRLLNFKTVGTLTLRLLMSYIYMEHPFLMFLDHTQRRTTVGRTPLDE